MKQQCHVKLVSSGLIFDGKDVKRKVIIIITIIIIYSVLIAKKSIGL